MLRGRARERRKGFSLLRVGESQEITMERMGQKI